MRIIYDVLVQRLAEQDCGFWSTLQCQRVINHLNTQAPWLTYFNSNQYTKFIINNTKCDQPERFCTFLWHPCFSSWDSQRYTQAYRKPFHNAALSPLCTASDHSSAHSVNRDWSCLQEKPILSPSCYLENQMQGPCLPFFPWAWGQRHHRGVQAFPRSDRAGRLPG